MTGAGYDVAMRITKTLCGPADGPDTAVIEFNRIEFSGLLDLHLETDFLADLGGASAQPCFHIVDHLLLGVAEINGKHDLARNDVARVRIDVAMADSANRKRGVRPGDFVDKLCDPRHAKAGIDPLRHRGRSGMRFLACQRDLKPVQPLPVGDDADIDILILEDRALFDMKLEEGGKPAGADLLVTDPADPLELAANRLAGGVRPAIGPVQRVHAGKYARRHHRRRETRAFLVRPVDHLDRVARLDAGLVQRADDLQPGQHPEDAVVFSTGRLRVEMASHHHRRQRRVSALAPGEHGAHLVEPHFKAFRLAPCLIETPPLGILVCQRLAVVAAGDAGADLRHLHQRIPQPVAINPEILAALIHQLGVHIGCH